MNDLLSLILSNHLFFFNASMMIVACGPYLTTTVIRVSRGSGLPDSTSV